MPRTRAELPADAGAIRDVETRAFGRLDEAVLVERLRATPGLRPAAGWWRIHRPSTPSAESAGA